MNKTWLLLFLIVSSIYSQNVSVRDYNVPVSRATNLRVNGFWNWAQVGDSVTGNTASANLIYTKFYTSLPFAWFFNVDANGGRDAGKGYYDVRIDGRVQKYIWNSRDWFGLSQLTMQRTNNYGRIASDFTIGAGYGRYINATALAKAVRIEEHLLEEGIITDYLPRETMINIANIIEREDEYKNLYGEVYETQWLNDIENEIQRTGLVEGAGFSSVGIRIRQVLFNTYERVNQRYYGWDISAGTLFTITTRDRSIPAGSPNLTVNGRFSFPFSWRTQVNITSGIFTPIDSSFARRVTANTSIDFIYELSNRINFLASYRFLVFKPDNLIGVADNNLTLSFLFYIENNIYLGISAGYENTSVTQRNIKTSINLSYNLF